jgi:hypothetical protein
VNLVAKGKTMKSILYLTLISSFLFSLPSQAALGDGYWSTSGRDLVDASKNKVRIAGVR